MRWNVPEQSGPSSPRCEYPAAASCARPWPASTHWRPGPHNLPSGGASVGSDFLPWNVPGDKKKKSRMCFIEWLQHGSVGPLMNRTTEVIKLKAVANKPLPPVGALSPVSAAIPSFSLSLCTAPCAQMSNCGVSPVPHGHFSRFIYLQVGKLIFSLSLPHISAQLPCAPWGHAALPGCWLEVHPGIFHSCAHPNPGKFPKNRSNKIAAEYKRYRVRSGWVVLNEVRSMAENP